MNKLLTHAVILDSLILGYVQYVTGDRGGTVVKVLCYKSEEVAGSIPDGVIGIFY